MGICDHNCADIAGLAAIFAAMTAIAADPFTVKINYDIGRLALYWRDFIRKQYVTTASEPDGLKQTGKRLLRSAGEKDYPDAAFFYALDELHGGNYQEGRNKLLDITESVFSDKIKTAAFRALAIDSERRLKDIPAALDFAKSGLKLHPESGDLRADFEKRIQRLEKNTRYMKNGKLSYIYLSNR